MFPTGQEMIHPEFRTSLLNTQTKFENVCSVTVVKELLPWLRPKYKTSKTGTFSL